VHAFLHLSVDCVPSRYILRRYTKDHGMETVFDRHDKMSLGLDGDTKARQTRSILSDLFSLQRSAIMSANAMEKDNSYCICNYCP
jgi:hypothetical protein